MNDKEFTNFVIEQCEQLHHERIMLEQQAKVNLDFMRLLKKKLILHIENHKNDDIIQFKCEDVLESPCPCDIRQYMDSDLINELATKGYTYIQETSTRKVITLSNNNQQ